MNSATLLAPSMGSALSLLRRSSFPDLRRLAVEETEEEVIVTGIVHSYYLKQLAQETIRGTVNGRRLRNRVMVVGR